MTQSQTDHTKAVILLSGGLDSTTTLAIAKEQGYELHALSFDYGQRHLQELNAASQICQFFDIHDHRIATIDLRLFGGSALTDNIDVPKHRDVRNQKDIPVTYVPARNTIFLSFALAYAETIGAFDIFIGANIVDYSGYPDCRPQYIEAFEHMANLATAATEDGANQFRIHRPLITMSKAEIIQEGLRLGVDYTPTFSCYDPLPDGSPCGECDSCQLRNDGFSANQLADPSLNVKKQA